MSRAIFFGLSLAISSLLGGCATTHDGVGGPLARCDANRVAMSRDLDRRVASASRIEVFSAASSGREGTPTPEPAMPAPDTRYAGPTPQVPIPVGGRGASPTGW